MTIIILFHCQLITNVNTAIAEQSMDGFKKCWKCEGDSMGWESCIPQHRFMKCILDLRDMIEKELTYICQSVQNMETNAGGSK